MVIAHLAASALAEAKVLPISLVRSSPVVGSSPSRSSAAATITRARCSSGVRLQAAKAADARSSAASTCASVWAGYSAMTSSVAGFTDR